MMDAITTERSQYPLSFPIIEVKKKDGSYRMSVELKSLKS